jgi:hypothetical protein
MIQESVRADGSAIILCLLTKGGNVRIFPQSLNRPEMYQRRIIMLKVAVVILVIMLAYGGVYSLMNIFVPKAPLKSAFESATGKTLDSIAGADAHYLKALVMSQRYMGVYALCTTIAGLFVLFAAFSKAKKWAWWNMLIVGGIIWLWGLIYSAAIGSTMNLVMHIIGIVLLILGLIIPIKEFFGGTAESAE